MAKNIFVEIDRLIGKLSVLGITIAALALTVIATSVIWEVFARSILHRPTIWAMEISTYSITVAGFLSAAYVLRQNGHLEITLLTQLMTKKTVHLLGIFTDFSAFLFCLIVVIYGIQLVELSYLIGAVSVSELRIDLWIPQLAVPIGFGLLGLEFICRIFVRLGLVDRVNQDTSPLLHG